MSWLRPTKTYTFMFYFQTVRGNFNKVISGTLVISFFVSAFAAPLGNIANAAVLTTGADGFITNIQTTISGAVARHSVSEGTGAFNYVHPLAVPPGINGFTPELALQYSSQSGSDLNIFGYGWSISIPYIERVNKVGVEELFSTTSPVFRSSRVGELIADGGSYVAKHEQGSFLSFTQSGNTWIARNNNGLQYVYGSTDAARQSDPADSSRTARWYLSSIIDAHGNAIDYTYVKDTGVIYPDRITYANKYAVQFSREASDAHTSYATGFLVERDQRISRIEILDDTNVFTRYDLTYTNGINGRRALLAGIVESAVAGSAVTARPATTFAYSGTGLPTWQADNTVDYPEPLGVYDTGVRFADLNGDGLPDIVRYYQRKEYDINGVNYAIRRVHLNQGNGNWDFDVPWDWGEIDVPLHYFVDASPDEYYNPSTFLIDLNGDGLDDYVIALGCEDDCHYADEALDGDERGVYLNTGSGFQKDTGWNLPDFSNWNQDHYFLRNEGRAFMDVNGDGLPDIVQSYFDTLQNGSPQANTLSNIKLNAGSGWVDTDWTFPTTLAKKRSRRAPYRRGWCNVRSVNSLVGMSSFPFPACRERK